MSQLCHLNYATASLWFCLTIILTSRIFHCSAECTLEGDMRFMEGQVIGRSIIECIDATTYDGLETYCGPDGIFLDDQKQMQCGDENPFCVNCVGGQSKCVNDPSTFVQCEVIENNRTLSPSLVNNRTVSPFQGCLVGDILFAEGQSTGHIGLECVNETSYDGSEGVCSSDGNIVQIEKKFTCPKGVPYCIQCGPKAEGDAFCLSTKLIPEQCEEDKMEPIVVTSLGGCLVGDIMYVEGQSTGHIGLECFNETSYYGSEGFCGSDGNIVDIENQFTCPDVAPNCVQCGPKGFGAALCLSTETDPNCEQQIISEPSESREGCLVGNVMYDEGETIENAGLECINESSYDALVTVCGLNGGVVESIRELTCPDVVHFCVQCGPRDVGAALCLSSKSSNPYDDCPKPDAFIDTFRDSENAAAGLNKKLISFIWFIFTLIALS